MRSETARRTLLLFGVLHVCFPPLLLAQMTESVGSRALGMGGAFVAVANDSTATWWNPAGLAAGPFLDMSFGRAVADQVEGGLEGGPASRNQSRWVSFASLPVGISHYRFQVTDIRAIDPVEGLSANRQDRRAGVPPPWQARSLSASQLGLTLVQTLVPGIHAGATLKYVRGTIRTLRREEASDDRPLVKEQLDAGEALEGGEADSTFDVDLGLLATAGPFRIGALVRHVKAPELGVEGASVTLARQSRAGVAFDAAAAGGPALTIALDVDLERTTTPAGRDRRNLAVGAEQWLSKQRIGLRGGMRMNREGAKERTGTFGASVAVRAGLFIDGHVVRGGAEGEEGWGGAARVSF